ncbi:hypothetical protein Tco_0880304 [Tanacetum coccineum]
MGLLKDVLCQVGVTTIIAKFLILDMPIDKEVPILVERGFLYTCGSILNTRYRVTSTFDGICHQTFRAAQTSVNTEESDSEDEEEYSIKRNSFKAPIYVPKSSKYLNCNDPMDRDLALQEVLNPFRKVCVCKKVVDCIEQFLNNFTNQPNETDINNLESDDESVDTPLVSPFPHSDNDLDDGEVLNELSEYENARVLRRERIINSFDRDDLAFQCMIGFRKFTAYLSPFLPMNIISRNAYNTIMVEGLKGTGKNLVAIVRDVYMFVKSFTYITDFVVLEDIGEFIMSDMAEVLMGKPFRKIIKLKYDVAKGLVSFTKIFDTYIFRMPRTIPRLMNFKWSKIPPLLELSQHDLMSGLRHPYEKNRFMYKNYLNLGLEYQVDESMKEWLIYGHVIFDKKKLRSS